MKRGLEDLSEDRALRDAARAVLRADIDHAKKTLSAKGVAARIGTRIGDGAKDVLEVARIHADDNRGVIATLIGAIALFMSRKPILEILGLATPDTPEGGEDTAADQPVDNEIRNDGVSDDAPMKSVADDASIKSVADDAPINGVPQDAPINSSGEDNEQ